MCLSVYFVNMSLLYLLSCVWCCFFKLCWFYSCFCFLCVDERHNTSVCEWVQYTLYTHCVFSRWNSDTTTRWGWTFHSLLILLSLPPVSEPILLTFLQCSTVKSLHSTLHYFMNRMFVIMTCTKHLQNPFQDNKTSTSWERCLWETLGTSQICFFIIIKINWFPFQMKLWNFVVLWIILSFKSSF